MQARATLPPVLPPRLLLLIAIGCLLISMLNATDPFLNSPACIYVNAVNLPDATIVHTKDF